MKFTMAIEVEEFPGISGLVVTAASGEEAKGIAKSFLENAGFEVEHAPRLEAIEAENGE